MKKSFGAYVVAWLAALGLFNVITFVTPAEINGVSKFDTLFWVAYAFITVFFIGELACVYFVFRAGSPQKTFYSIPLCVSSLAVMLVVGGLCMAIIQIPEWIGIIACSIVLAVNVISVARAIVAVGAVAAIDQKIKTRTLFIKMLTADAQVLMTKTDDEELLKLTKQVYEAVRYSDPMSDPALGAVEDKITDAFNEFSSAIEAGDSIVAPDAAKALLSLISERNAKCKILK